MFSICKFVVQWPKQFLFVSQDSFSAFLHVLICTVWIQTTITSCILLSEGVNHLINVMNACRPSYSSTVLFFYPWKALFCWGTNSRKPHQCHEWEGIIISYLNIFVSNIVTDVWATVAAAHSSKKPLKAEMAKIWIHMSLFELTHTNRTSSGPFYLT